MRKMNALQRLQNEFATLPESTNIMRRFVEILRSHPNALYSLWIANTFLASIEGTVNSYDKKVLQNFCMGHGINSNQLVDIYLNLNAEDHTYFTFFTTKRLKYAQPSNVVTAFRMKKADTITFGMHTISRGGYPTYNKRLGN